MAFLPRFLRFIEFLRLTRFVRIFRYPRMASRSSILLRLTLLGSLVLPLPASAGMFDDDEARRAVIDLRDKINAFQATATDRFDQSGRALFDLQNQLTQLKEDNAQLRGQNESLQNEISKLQKMHLDYYRDLDERIKKVEPKLMMIEGREGLVGLPEQKDYEQALKAFRDNDMKNAVLRFQSFIQRYPSSVYLPLAEFWLGNAFYSQRDCKAAMPILQTMIQNFANHPKVADAWSVIGSCQLEQGQKSQARKTFDMLIAKYPGSDAAVLAKQRLTQLK